MIVQERIDLEKKFNTILNDIRLLQISINANSRVLTEVKQTVRKKDKDRIINFNN